MPVSPAYAPEPAFTELGDEFSDAVAPADFPALTPRFWNARAAATVGLETLSEAERAAHFGRFTPLPGQPGPRAMRYHGHQFRTYNPDLGDGRGFLAAQLRETGSGRLLDLGTKGSGVTPWSRAGDGRLTLKGAVRELLAATMLETLGVPTSRTFAVYETHEQLSRGDEPSPTRSAVLTRLSWSHVRFGTFQRAAYFDRPDMVAALIDHCVAFYYPELTVIEGAAARAPALLRAAAARTAAMTAGWMAAGFVHGVLNTDNMNVTGESFDYGPWRFLPKDDPTFTAAYFDHSGLYAFGRQPTAVFWNLQQLAASLTVVEPDKDALIDALNSFAPAYRKALAAAMLGRLAVKSLGEEADASTVEAAFAALSEGGAAALRWEPFFFDWFGGEPSQARALAGPRGAIYDGPAFKAFREQLMMHPPDRPERLASAVFSQTEPEEMLIDEVEALWSAIAERDDWTPLYAKLDRLDAARVAYSLAGTLPQG